MPLLNYTTSIDARKTLGEVQGLLSDAGASEIAVRYDKETRRPSGVQFSIDTPFGERWYTLPANVEPVLATLARQRKRSSSVKATPEQAERVAWRIIKNWLEAQLAIIETGMVAFHQIMLPYMHAGDDGLTVFQVMEAVELKSLPAPKRGS
jgi:hypothetical protein